MSERRRAQRNLILLGGPPRNKEDQRALFRPRLQRVNPLGGDTMRLWTLEKATKDDITVGARLKNTAQLRDGEIEHYFLRGRGNPKKKRNPGAFVNRSHSTSTDRSGNGRLVAGGRRGGRVAGVLGKGDRPHWGDLLAERGNTGSGKFKRWHVDLEKVGEEGTVTGRVRNRTMGGHDSQPATGREKRMSG